MGLLARLLGHTGSVVDVLGAIETGIRPLQELCGISHELKAAVGTAVQDWDSARYVLLQDLYLGTELLVQPINIFSCIHLSFFLIYSYLSEN